MPSRESFLLKGGLQGYGGLKFPPAETGCAGHQDIDESFHQGFAASKPPRVPGEDWRGRELPANDLKRRPNLKRLVRSPGIPVRPGLSSAKHHSHNKSVKTSGRARSSALPEPW